MFGYHLLFGEKDPEKQTNIIMIILGTDKTGDICLSHAVQIIWVLCCMGIATFS